jgi:hypothetical protein
MKIEVLVAIVICFCSVIGSVTYYNVVQQEKFAENLKFAIDKGIDPMAVRCSYDKMSDAICVAYAASGKKAESAPMVGKR